MNLDCAVLLVGSTGTLRARVQGDLESDASEVIERLRRLTPGAERAGPGFVDGRRVEPGDRLADLGLVDGVAVSFGRPVAALPRGEVPPLTLRLTGGPGAGWAYPLRPGRLEMGRDAHTDLPLPDGQVSRHHASVHVEDSAVLVEDAGSAYGTSVDGRRLDGVAAVPAGAVIGVGSTLLEVGQPGGEPLPLVRDGGQLAVHRRYRAALASWSDRIAFPRPPAKTEAPSLNLLWTFLPAVAFLAIALATKRMEMMLFVAVSPLVSVGRSMSQRRGWRRKRAADGIDYAQAVDAAAEQLANASANERASRRAADPDLAELAVQARLPGRRLWERRPDDDDFLSLRVGAATLRSSIIVSGDDERSAPEVPAAPVTVSLRDARNLAVIGPTDSRRRAAAGLLVQLAVRESPVDVKLMVIAGDGEDAMRAWEWVTWLPHAHWSSSHPFVLVGSDTLSRKQRLAELRDLVNRRRDARSGHREVGALPAVVVVLDDALAALNAGYAELLATGPAVGVHFISLDETQVPDQCEASLHLPAMGMATFGRRGHGDLTGVIADLPDWALVDEVARFLAPLRPAAGQAGSELPSRLRLADLPDLPSLEASTVAERWKRGDGRRGGVPVGATADGPLLVDLPSDGPHTLLAGTTRSGKSEFIKTLVASLALGQHPDDLGFVFIDFKGGADYRLLSELPHCVALATEQDMTGFTRAVDLLDAEVKRRRRLLNDAGTPSIEGYATARRDNSGLPPIGRLVVVVDEFARLASDASEQLDRLVAVAQTGAASGVHLVLATQSPHGVVRPQMDANVALRICFRVEKDEESRAVIGRSDAHTISPHTRGRAFLTSHGGPLVGFQAARVAGARPGASVPGAGTVVSPVTWGDCGHAVDEVVAEEVPDGLTDLADVVRACRAAAAASGWTTQAVPWPAPLPAAITLDMVSDSGDPELIPFALLDDTAAQAWRPVGLALGGANIGIGGAPRSGRTTALRAVAMSIAAQRRADDVHLYALDFGRGGLRPLDRLAHMGGLAVGDMELSTRILDELGRMVDVRLDDFAAMGLSDIAHQRATGERPMPYLVLLVDGWDVLVEEGNRSGLNEMVTSVLDRGARAGLQAVVTGDRSVGVGTMGRRIEDRYALRFNDPNDYDFMGIGHRARPVALPSGRLLSIPDGRQAQVALIAPDDAGQAEAIRREVDALAARDAGLAGRPRRIASLPTRVSLSDVQASASGAGMPLALGVSGANSLVTLDLANGPSSVFVVGPPATGRTTALRAMACHLMNHGVRVALVTPKQSALAELADDPNAVSLVAGPAAHALDLDALGGAQVVVVDDADLLDPEHPAHRALAAGKTAARLVVAGPVELVTTSNIRWGSLLKKARTGLLLSPQVGDGNTALGGRLPDAYVFRGPPGRAVASHAGRLEVVQVPMA